MIKCLLVFLLAPYLIDGATKACKYRHKKVGCFWQDDDAEELFNVRSLIPWNKEQVSFVNRMVCDCENAAREKDYKYFAIRFYGLCIGLKKIAKAEKSLENCPNGKYMTCNLEDKTDCTGDERHSDMVYEIGRDGGYGKWGDFGECSVTCGTGIVGRTRKCDNPTPIANGDKCDVLGPAVETKECTKKVCPVDGGFGDWSSWTKCSTTCGIGQITRARKCDSPAPVGTGKDCEGLSTQLKVCISSPCRVDGGFGDWSAWSECSKSCGGGSHKRSRKCDNPPPSHGGKVCKGDLKETKACVNDLCKDATGIAKAQELVEEFLKNFHKSEFPDKTPSGKFYKAIFAVQKAVAEEFSSVDPTAREKSLEKRLKDLEKFLKAATDGGSIDFARNTLGKGLFTYMKQKIKEGLPIDDLDAAAKGYLDKLTTDIGQDKMNQILSSQGDATLMFTMDTTGSMSDEIAAAKAIARKIIDSTRDFDVDYILSPFNDPGAGPVKYKTTEQRAGFVSDINSLQAVGGGDCPELAFKGMLNAIDHGPKYGSPMFVFTDATAKDDSISNMAALKAAATMSGTTITFFTNLQGCASGAKRGIESYKEIASATSGQVFPLKNEAELLKFTEYVKNSLEQDTLIASGGELAARYKRSLGRQHSFNVDTGIAKLIVSAAVSTPNSAGQVTMTSPDGGNVGAKTTMSMARMFEVANPMKGAWVLTFPNGVGKYEFNAQAVSNDPIEFSYYFLYQENAERNSPIISMIHPFKDRKNMLVLQIGGAGRITLSSLTVDVIDLNGQIVMRDLKLTPMDSKDVYNTTLTPPNIPFKIRLKGEAKTGEQFERISREVARPATSHMRPTFAGDEFTATLGAGQISVQMQILNIGDEDTFAFKVAANTGTISPVSQTKSIRNMGFINFSFNPPSAHSQHGHVERITVTARKRRSGEVFSQNVNILLLKP